MAAVGVPDPLHGDGVPRLPESVESGLNHLLSVAESADGTEAFDMAAAAPVVAFIRQAPEMAYFLPRERINTRGAFMAYSIVRPLQEVVRYAYNSRIPGGAVNPSSIHHSQWLQPDGRAAALPDIWRLLDGISVPEVVRGVARETISPDLHTGAYYEYDLDRALILYRQGDQRVVISLSLQIGHSDVGRKGFVVGDDEDWNYLYTDHQGLNRTGLGWVRSRIYQFFSICVYVADDNRPGRVRVGVFQWLGAGWAGINMVDSHHIRNGMERYALQFKAMLESAQMPDPVTLERVTSALAQTDERILRQNAHQVILHIQDRARQQTSGRIRQTIDRLDPADHVGAMSRQELITVLTREFVKFSLGKETPLKAPFWLALQSGGVSQKPLS